MRIEITQDDIDTGVADDCFTCPIAKAIGRATGGTAVEINTRTAWWNVGDKAYVAPLPRAAKLFINRFDSNQSVRPFVLTLHPKLLIC